MPPSLLDDNREGAAEVSAALARCDSAPRVALATLDAKWDGRYTSFCSPWLYMELQSMQEETSFINYDPSTEMTHCTQSNGIYNDILCPPIHFNKTQEVVLNGYAAGDLDCSEGFQCLYQPCVKAFDVDSKLGAAFHV